VDVEGVGDGADVVVSVGLGIGLCVGFCVGEGDALLG